MRLLVGATRSICVLSWFMAVAVADHLDSLGGAFAQVLDLAAQLRGLERTLGDEQEAVGLERLLDIVVGAAFDRGHGGFDVAVAGNDDHRQLGVDLANDREDFEAVEAAALQPDVENDEVRLARFDCQQRLVAVAREAALVAFIFENAGDKLTDVSLVIDDQNVRCHRSILSLTVALLLWVPVQSAGAGACDGVVFWVALPSVVTGRR